jgi:hypothetical protein
MNSKCIISRLECGLGNQLFQYAAGRAVSLRLGCPLHLDTRWYQNFKRPFELDAFRIEATVVGRLEAFRVRLSTGPRIKPLRSALNALLPGLILPSLVDAEAGYDPRLAEVDRSVYLHGFWQSPRYFETIREQLLEELAFKRAPDAENQNTLDAIAATNAVAVHVRRGDYLRSDVGLLYFCGLDYYRAAIDIVRSRLASPHLFVFSDDPDWAAANIKSDLPVTLVRHNTGRRNIEDLRLMKACRHFIIANSTFSWWGAWLSTHANQLVICPERWFSQPHPSEKDLIPPEWMRVAT